MIKCRCFLLLKGESCLLHRNYYLVIYFVHEQSNFDNFVVQLNFKFKIYTTYTTII